MFYCKKIHIGKHLWQYHIYNFNFFMFCQKYFFIVSSNKNTNPIYAQISQMYVNLGTVSSQRQDSLQISNEFVIDCMYACIYEIELCKCIYIGVVSHSTLYTIFIHSIVSKSSRSRLYVTYAFIHTYTVNTSPHTIYVCIPLFVTANILNFILYLLIYFYFIRFLVVVWQYFNIYSKNLIHLCGSKIYILTTDGTIFPPISSSPLSSLHHHHQPPAPPPTTDSFCQSCFHYKYKYPPFIHYFVIVSYFTTFLGVKNQFLLIYSII